MHFFKMCAVTMIVLYKRLKYFKIKSYLDQYQHTRCALAESLENIFAVWYLNTGRSTPCPCLEQAPAPCPSRMQLPAGSVLRPLA